MTLREIILWRDWTGGHPPALTCGPSSQRPQERSRAARRAVAQRLALDGSEDAGTLNAIRPRHHLPPQKELLIRPVAKVRNRRRNWGNSTRAHEPVPYSALTVKKTLCYQKVNAQNPIHEALPQSTCCLPANPCIHEFNSTPHPEPFDSPDKTHYSPLLVTSKSCSGIPGNSPSLRICFREYPMDYLLENLGPEKFQEVCHALLAKAFPKTQCFPVGQRDGGRDAISFLQGKGSDDFIVYQVKYARKPLAEQKPHDWLKGVVKEEAPKIRKLIPKGAKGFYLLTNVPGTSFLDSGSIDIVQKCLNVNFDIPAQCWWRDDVNRRMDDAWSIKWSYPEILSGPDILRYIIESNLSEDAERRTSAIRAFLRDQLDRDTEVRFRQVELQNKLLDLFIDVPIDTSESVTQRQFRGKVSMVIQAVEKETSSPSHHSEENHLGAATLLLHPLSQEHLNRVVIEGAPGQGKSTVVQYVCQIHRQRILDEKLTDGRIPDTHRDCPVRIPFKIDCRDFSIWLTRQNPFSAEDTDSVPTDWQKSLESFLAANVLHYSGGAAFSVSDLHAVLRITTVLLVFDGLDEVADIIRRREVVDQILKGVTRLQELAVSVQTIVTSRPAAFANSPGMPESTFRYFNLTSINRPLITQYAEKWLRARKLEGKEASDVRRILRDKLDQPHLRELARNPMQLAILLSLIQTRGGSLPDKRTSLYDSYVELFFNREAEKSIIVRDHRDLLVNIHEYLAWTLHAESQTKRTRGSVSGERLRNLVEGYLADEDHDSSLAHQLFTGMVERVVALVSRVEGTYEFEVQPLREYFAARYLYNTAPYSPPGSPQNGTLPERFDALCRDFYWQNVTRFYAGCYSKGELPSLVDRLEDLARAPGYRNTSHPQSLAATLLADWVFAQHPRSMKQVVALILDGIGLNHIKSGDRWYKRQEVLVLPKQSGKEELVDRCFALLTPKIPLDYGTMLVDLIRVNATREFAKEQWLIKLAGVSGPEKTRWIEYGLYLAVFPMLSSKVFESFLDDETENCERISLLLRGNQEKFVEEDPTRFRAAIDCLLSTSPRFGFRSISSIIYGFEEALNPMRYAIAFSNRHPLPLTELWVRMLPTFSERLSLPPKYELPPGNVPRNCQIVVDSCVALAEQSASNWATELNPWNELVELLRQLFGDRWLIFVLANTSAGIRSKSEVCNDATDLHDERVPLCRRTRYARLRAGASGWWKEQLALAANQEEVAFALLVFLSWAGPRAIAKHLNMVDNRIRSLEYEWWIRLAGSLAPYGYGVPTERRNVEIDLGNLTGEFSERTVVALSSRVGERASIDLFQRCLKEYDGGDPIVLNYCLKSALDSALVSPRTWGEWLPIISRCYAKGAKHDRHFGRMFAHIANQETLPGATAELIMRNYDAYPAELVALAERTCRQNVLTQVIPVGTVAERDGWFRL